jgi:hypothetical protein
VRASCEIERGGRTGGREEMGGGEVEGERVKEGILRITCSFFSLFVESFS